MFPYEQSSTLSFNNQQDQVSQVKYELLLATKQWTSAPSVFVLSFFWGFRFSVLKAATAPTFHSRSRGGTEYPLAIIGLLLLMLNPVALWRARRVELRAVDGMGGASRAKGVERGQVGIDCRQGRGEGDGDCLVLESVCASESTARKNARLQENHTWRTMGVCLSVFFLHV